MLLSSPLSEIVYDILKDVALQIVVSEVVHGARPADGKVIMTLRGLGLSPQAHVPFSLNALQRV